MNVIVFSKDRPALLDLFIRSAEKYFEEFKDIIIYVIIKDSNEFKIGYDILEDNYEDTQKRIIFISEENFKEDVLYCINEKEKYTVFFTDDDIFCNPFSIRDTQFNIFDKQEDIICLSLRLNPNITYCYPQSRDINKPEFRHNNIYLWGGQQGYYGYPMSVNGHIFRTEDILPLLKKLDYNNPTWLEYQLSLNPINKPFMMCYDKSIIVNNPINRVQDICENRNEGLDNKIINDMFLNGKRLSLNMVDGIEVKTCHQPIKLIWE